MWDHVNGWCLLPFGNNVWFFPPSPDFWSPCFLPRERTANFQLVLNVGLVFFNINASLWNKTLPGLRIKCLLMVCPCIPAQMQTFGEKNLHTWEQRRCMVPYGHQRHTCTEGTLGNKSFAGQLTKAAAPKGTSKKNWANWGINSGSNILCAYSTYLLCIVKNLNAFDPL